ncbi:MAG: carbon-nitrogen hydrolase family protein [Sulfurovum sp.]|jgi:predicted amidohydrolase|nr:carbon-nitrogen hydrolase family protein [Sulfurovum sp.]
MQTFQEMEAVSLQLPVVQRYQDNLEKLIECLKKHQNKTLIVAPEVCLTGFDYTHLKTAAKFSAKALKIIKKIVERQIVVLTLVLEDRGGFVNRAVVIHKHKVVHRQEKVKLFALGNETRYFLPGKKKNIKPFEIEGVKYALLICFELRFKMFWKQIEGADIVVIPARWGLPRKQHLEILSRALAVMNQCYVIVSDSSDADMARSSSIISPNGNAVQDDAQSQVEGIVDLREIKRMRRYIAMN